MVAGVRDAMNLIASVIPGIEAGAKRVLGIGQMIWSGASRYRMRLYSTVR